jgi:hypothetical protein
MQSTSLDPAKALKMCYCVADAVCPPWNGPDTEIMDSRGWSYSHQTKTDEKEPYDSYNFYYWNFDRETTPGLVRNLLIVWGDYAVARALNIDKKHGGPLYFRNVGNAVPILVQFKLDITRMAAPGPHDKKGTTLYRLNDDMTTAMYNILGAMAYPMASWQIKQF